jgi:hypothetical protein
LHTHVVALDDIVLLGQLVGSAGRVVRVTSDLYERLSAADDNDACARRLVDVCIMANGLDVPKDPALPPLGAGFAQALRASVDLERGGITRSGAPATAVTCPESTTHSWSRLAVHASRKG